MLNQNEKICLMMLELQREQVEAKIKRMQCWTYNTSMQISAMVEEEVLKTVDEQIQRFRDKEQNFNGNL